MAFFKWREEYSIDAKSLIDKYSMKLQRDIDKSQNQVNHDSIYLCLSLPIYLLEFQSAFLTVPGAINKQDENDS